MTEVSISNQLPGSTRLWRYVSLDKLVDLLSTSELYFTPLANFKNSDPYEGYLPKVALNAHASISRKYIEDAVRMHEQVAEHRERLGAPLTVQEREALGATLDNVRTSMRRFMPAIVKATVVNCWHANESESEAMWRLYAENGKAVAVETTLDALKQSIEVRDFSGKVHIFPVRYLDFFDSNLQPRDCVVEGHLAPLLKRNSYQHEQEVRAFIGKVAPNPHVGSDISFWKPEPVRLPVDVKTLVAAVYVSPYATEPFPSSVAAVCEAFGLGSGIVKPSRLLSGDEELLDCLIV
jgi:hypothetical protein